MIEFSRDNFYKYEPDAISILLIDKNAALSGEAMKQLNYRLPDIYDALKQRLLKLGDKVGLGSIVKVNKYYFIVCRENYHRSWDKNIFLHSWKVLTTKVANKKFIIDIEDYEEMSKILQENQFDASIKICNHCAFGDDWE